VYCSGNGFVLWFAESKHLKFLIGDLYYSSDLWYYYFWSVCKIGTFGKEAYVITYLAVKFHYSKQPHLQNEHSCVTQFHCLNKKWDVIQSPDSWHHPARSVQCQTQTWKKWVSLMTDYTTTQVSTYWCLIKGKLHNNYIIEWVKVGWTMIPLKVSGCWMNTNGNVWC